MTTEKNRLKKAADSLAALMGTKKEEPKPEEKPKEER